ILGCKMIIDRLALGGDANNTLANCMEGGSLVVRDVKFSPGAYQAQRPASSRGKVGAFGAAMGCQLTVLGPITLAGSFASVFAFKKNGGTFSAAGIPALPLGVDGLKVTLENAAWNYLYSGNGGLISAEGNVGPIYTGTGSGGTCYALGVMGSALWFPPEATSP